MSHYFPVNKSIAGVFLPVLASFCLLAVCVPPNVPAQNIPPLVITCLGDSVTHSYPHGEGDPLEDVNKTYAGKLASKLDDNYYAQRFQVNNRGVNGGTADSTLALLVSQGLPENPDFVLLMIGGNDLAGATVETFGAVVEQTTTEVQQCVDEIKAHINPGGQPPTVLLAAFTPNRIPDVGGWNPNIGIRTYNGQHWFFSPLLYDLSEVTDVDLYFYSNFDDLYDTVEERAYQDKMYDNVHPNEDGYEVMAQNWFDELATFPELMDSDSDGITDALEDANGNGSYDAGTETDPDDYDTDNDGVSDFIEITCAGVDTALNPSLYPSMFKVNFQPFRVVTPGGHLLDGGRTFTTGTGFGWR